MKELPVLPVRTYIKIFDTMVMPILLYGSEVWGPHLYKINKNTQILKLMLKNCTLNFVNRCSSNIGVRSELGR